MYGPHGYSQYEGWTYWVHSEAWSSSRNTCSISNPHLNNKNRGQRNRWDFVIHKEQRPGTFKETVKESLNEELKHCKRDLLNDVKR